MFVSDRSGWWNLYRFDLASRSSQPLLPMEAEFGLPQWMFGMSSYAFAGRGRIVCTYSKAGLGQLALLDLASGSLRPIETPFSEFGSLRADGDRVVFRAGAPNLPTSIVALDLASGRHSVLKQATDMLDGTQGRIADYLTTVETIEFPTTGGRTAFGLFYPPHNPDYTAPAARGRRSWSNATAGRPRLRRARSISARSFGPAAGSRCSTSITAAAPASAAPTAIGCI